MVGMVVMLQGWERRMKGRRCFDHPTPWTRCCVRPSGGCCRLFRLLRRHCGIRPYFAILPRRACPRRSFRGSSCAGSSAENVSEQILNSGKKIAKSSQQIVPKMSVHMPFAGQASPFMSSRAAQEAAARRNFAEALAGESHASTMMQVGTRRNECMLLRLLRKVRRIAHMSSEPCLLGARRSAIMLLKHCYEKSDSCSASDALPERAAGRAFLLLQR